MPKFISQTEAVSSTSKWLWKSGRTTRAISNNYRTFTKSPQYLLQFSSLSEVLLFDTVLQSRLETWGQPGIIKLFSIDHTVMSQEQHKIFLWPCQCLSSYYNTWEKPSSLNLSHEFSGLSILSHSISISPMTFPWNRSMEDHVNVSV